MPFMSRMRKLEKHKTKRKEGEEEVNTNYAL